MHAFLSSSSQRPVASNVPPKHERSQVPTCPANFQTSLPGETWCWRASGVRGTCQDETAAVTNGSFEAGSWRWSADPNVLVVCGHCGVASFHAWQAPLQPQHVIQPALQSSEFPRLGTLAVEGFGRSRCWAVPCVPCPECRIMQNPKFDADAAPGRG